MSSAKGSISSENRPSLDGRLSNQYRETILSNDQLKCILTIFVNIALILLPLYASDYPSIDKRGYFKLLVQWAKRTQSVVDHYMTEFKGGQFVTSVTGPITVLDFIQKSKQLEIFNVLQIREVAKKTILISDHNPRINRDALISKGLFSANRYAEGSDLNEDEEAEDATEEALTDLPQMFSDAVLYKIVEDIDSQLQQTQKVTIKE